MIYFLTYPRIVGNPINTVVKANKYVVARYINVSVKPEILGLRCHIIITGVNADIGGEYVSKFIMKFKSFNADVSFHSTLGAKNYLALMNYGKNEKVLVIGNSSSIVKEVPFFKCVGVLIGGRQKGRELANNTIQIDADSNMIMSCIDNCIFNYEKIISQDNPYYVKDSVNKAAEFIYKVFSANTNEIIKNIYEELKYE